MDTLQFILDKYKLKVGRHSPIEIPNTGRNNLPELFVELGFTKGAEIGVYKGEYSEIICKANPEVELYCIDSWVNYENFVLDEMEISEQQTRERLSPYKNVHIMPTTSEEASKKFEDNSLDFVYIDGNHDFLHVAQDLCFWERKVKVGGILAGHDYYVLAKQRKRFNRMSVTFVVDAYTAAHNIHPWFLLGSKAKIKGQIRDYHRSFMWIKKD